MLRGHHAGSGFGPERSRRGRPGRHSARSFHDSLCAHTAAASGCSRSTSYLLGPEDLITVRVFAADDIPDKPVQIDNDGTVTLPMIGPVHAAGLTVEQFQANLVTAYKKYFKDPQVTVQVNEFHSQPVSVAGNVMTPGVVQLRGNRNLMEVIGQAGGLRPDAGDTVLITRNLSEGPIPVAGAFTDPTGKYSVAHIDIRAVMNGKDPQGNILIKPHDVITVPRARMIYVLGNVTKPGGYVMYRKRDHVGIEGGCPGRRMGQDREALRRAGSCAPMAARSGNRFPPT